MKVSVLLISTNRYKEFVQPLLDGINKYFLPNQQVDVNLFTDEIQVLNSTSRVFVHQHIIPSYKFPEATLFRFKIFHEYREFLSNYDFLLYMDVDMRIENVISEDIFQGDLVAVIHPGFYASGGWGSNGVHELSTAFVPKEDRQNYVAGGVQGGESSYYLKACEELSFNIETDAARGILAEWHDESHWNHYIRKRNIGSILYLTPIYCMVEPVHQRVLWGIDNLPVIIVAIDKDHAAMRA